MRKLDLSKVKPPEEVLAETERIRDDAREQIRRRIDCRRFLEKSKGGLYCCPICKSGHGPHKTGAVVYYSESNRWQCKSCYGTGEKGTPKEQGRPPFDSIDTYMIVNGVDYDTALRALAEELGIDLDAAKQKKDKKNSQTKPQPTKTAPASDPAPETPGKGEQALSFTGETEEEFIPFEDETEPGQQAQGPTAPENSPAAGPNSPATPADDKTYQDGQKAGENANIHGENGIEDFTLYYDACRARLDDPAAISYLQARGISRETAYVYGLGYDPAWISPTVIKNQQAKGSDWRPPATARIIIPISSNYYIARAADPAVTEYAKMNETGGGDVGIFRITEFLNTSNKYIFITEGAFDALAIFEEGRAAVALNSTSNANLLLTWLEDHPTKGTAILCLDNDEAGRKCTEVLAEGFDRLNVSYVKSEGIFCGCKDPNEAHVKDPEAFRAALENACTDRPHSVKRYIQTLMGADIEKNKTVYPTGFSELDKNLDGGLVPGLYAVGAIPSLGKTSFCLQLADQIAEAGHDVLFFSLEQSRLELVSKSISRITAKTDIKTFVESKQIRKGYLPKQVIDATEKYIESVGDRLSIIEGNFNCSISFIGDYIRDYVRRNDARPVTFIDYLQILKPAGDKRQTTKETIDETVTELRRLSRELCLPIVVISSFNRTNYLTPVDFESFKESGGIEYTSDTVLGLQLDCINESLFDKVGGIKAKRERIRKAKAATPRKVELLALKNRGGRPSFSCRFSYYPAAELFVSDIPGEKKTLADLATTQKSVRI